MLDFPSAREAKEYLAGRVEQEAIRQGIVLTPVERSMLLFSETDWAPPDILDVSEAFDRDYDQAEYERKLAPIVTAAHLQAAREGPDTAAEWTRAVKRLSSEDHYLLVLLAVANGSLPVVESGMFTNRYWVKPLVIGILVALLAGSAVIGISLHMRPH